MEVAAIRFGREEVVANGLQSVDGNVCYRPSRRRAMNGQWGEERMIVLWE